jgi:DNA modification methylase
MGMISAVDEPPVAISKRWRHYVQAEQKSPLLICGDALEVLRELPAETIDCCLTSPPYWGHRRYESGGIGLENNPESYVRNLLLVIHEIQRVLKKTGSFWLNIGDSYRKKSLQGIPWRVALKMIDEQGWVLRNAVTWNKVKGGPDNSKDKLRNVHEDVFHFVKSRTGYFYDVNAIRKTPGKTKIVNGAVVSATGVSGVRYRRQIELSTALSPLEKEAAFDALEEVMEDLRTGKYSDFRMIIRGQQRTTHSDSTAVSGRAKELQQKGFYFLKYHPKGTKPGDVWDIIPEDTQNRTEHFAPFPMDLCRLPIISTCPEKGIVLDPFCGTGTANIVACRLGRKSIGIDLSAGYIRTALERVLNEQPEK